MTRDLEANPQTKTTLHSMLFMTVCFTLHPPTELKLSAPASIHGTLLSYCHDHPTAGHLGFSKTLVRLRFRFVWHRLAADVKRYVTSCSVCQLSKPSQRKPAGLVPILLQKPWEYKEVDFVSPLPRTASGYAYLLVLVDYFSEWIEVCAVKEETVQVAAGKVVSEVLFEHVVSTLGSVNRLTTAYHAQTNATECVNWTLKTAICTSVGDKHTVCDKDL